MRGGEPLPLHKVSLLSPYFRESALPTCMSKHRAVNTKRKAATSTTLHVQSTFVQAVLNTQSKPKESRAFLAGEGSAARRGQKRKHAPTNKGVPQTLVCRTCRKEVHLENADSSAQCPACRNPVLTVPRKSSANCFRTGSVPF